MKQYFGSYIGSDGKSEIACRFLVPDDAPRGIIQIAHGMCEDMSDYRETAEFFTAYGYIVCGNDALGHGRTAGTVNRLGHFSDKNGWRYLVKDFLQMNRIIRKKYPSLPVYAIGHSMGSLILRSAITIRGFKCDGAVLLGTTEGCGMADFLAVSSLILRTIYGRRHRDEKSLRLICSLLGATYRGSFSWASRDKKAVHSCERRFFIMTAGAYCDIMLLLKSVSGERCAELVRADIPVMIMSGGGDPVGCFGADPLRLYNRLRDCGVKRLELKIYPKARHELLHEYNRRDVCEDILGRITSLGKATG